MSKPLAPSDVDTAAAETLLRTPSKSRNTVGTRNTETRFAEIRDDVVLALLLEPSSFFHLALLYRNYLLQELGSIVTSLEDILLALADIRRNYKSSPKRSDLLSAKRFLSSAPEGNSLRSLESVDHAASSVTSFLDSDLDAKVSGAASGTGRTRREARSDIANALDGLEVDPLFTKLEGLLTAAEDYPLESMAASLSDGLRGRLSDVVDGLLRSVDEGRDQEEAQSTLLKALSIKASLRALRNATSPTEAVLSSSPAVPKGSLLDLLPVAPVIPAVAEGTAGVFGVPVAGDLVFEMNGGGPYYVSPFASGRHFLVSRPFQDGASLTVTFGYMLLQVGSTATVIPLTTGSRTPGQVAAEITSGLPGGSATLEGNRLLIRHTSPLQALSSAIVVEQAQLKTSGLVEPVVFAGGALVIRYAFGSPLSSPAVGRAIVFPLGSHTLQNIITVLNADLTFTDDVEVGQEDGELTISLKLPLQSNSWIEVDATLSTAVPGKLPFDINRHYGHRQYFGTDAPALGFDLGQPSTSEYSPAEVIRVFDELVEGLPVAPDMTLVEQTSTLTSGTGYWQGGQLRDDSVVWTELGLALGDEVAVMNVGLLQLVAIGAGGVTLSGAGAEGTTATYTIRRRSLVLSSTDTELTSHIEVTESAGFGIPLGEYLPTSNRVRINGRLKGDKRKTDKSPGSLGLVVGAVFGDSTVTEITEDSRVVFDVAPESLEDFEFYLPGRAEFLSLLRELRPLLVTREPFARIREDVELATHPGDNSALLHLAARKLAGLLFSLDTASPRIESVREALSLLGPVSVIPATSLREQLEAYSPTLPEDVTGTAEDCLEALRSAGFDRAADMLLQLRIESVVDMAMADEASYAGYARRSTKQTADTIKSTGFSQPVGER